MTNPFHPSNLIPNWTTATEILKGDLPGHVFHGNQYSQAAGMADSARELHRVGRNGGEQPGERPLSPQDFVDIHSDYAGEHEGLAGRAATPEAKQAHLDAAAAHDRAAEAWSRPASVFAGEALQATKAASDASTKAAERVAVDQRMQDAAAAGRPTDRSGNPIVTKESPAVVVPESELTPAERAEYFRDGPAQQVAGRPYAESITLPDGMVNPRTGEIGTGKNVSYGYNPAEPVMIVQGSRSGGSTFTRVIALDGKIGDTMTFRHDQTGAYLGDGKVIGIVEPATGKAYGDFPDKKLSHHVFK